MLFPVIRAILNKSEFHSFIHLIIHSFILPLFIHLKRCVLSRRAWWHRALLPLPMLRERRKLSYTTVLSMDFVAQSRKKALLLSTKYARTHKPHTQSPCPRWTCGCLNCRLAAFLRLLILALTQQSQGPGSGPHWSGPSAGSVFWRYGLGLGLALGLCNRMLLFCEYLICSLNQLVCGFVWFFFCFWMILLSFVLSWSCMFCSFFYC